MEQSDWLKLEPGDILTDVLWIIDWAGGIILQKQKQKPGFVFVLVTRIGTALWQSSQS